ncbi:MAG TPA: DUF433 domain-containing protein [Polyangiaceae bacterium]
MNEPPLDWQERISVDPAVLVGKPVIRGTRLAVEFVIELMANGWTPEEVVENYPGIALEDVRACLAYARNVLEQERVFATPSA